MRDSFIFYRSFFESFSDLSKKDKLVLFEAVCNYALNDIEPELLGAPSAMFKLLKPQLDANARRYENGKKGGRPKGNLDETKPKPNLNLDETKAEPNVNVNVNPNPNNLNVNLNANVNEKENASGSANTDVWSLSRSVISYLNQEAGTEYKADAAPFVKLISDLCHKGYTEADMKRVVDVKVADWREDPKVSQYLRPSTLFGPKFAEYLAQPMPEQMRKAEQKKARTADNAEKAKAYQNELDILRDNIVEADTATRIRLKEREAWLEDEIRRLS